MRGTLVIYFYGSPLLGVDRDWWEVVLHEAATISKADLVNEIERCGYDRMTAIKLALAARNDMPTWTNEQGPPITTP